MFSEIVSKTLAERSLDQPLMPLGSWSGVGKASALLANHIQKGNLICIWGDYDVDGVTATALFLKGIHELRVRNNLPGDVCFHIPHRFSEGYGINTGFIPNLVENGVSCFVSVDCGITSHEAVSMLKKAGIETVITDHHLPPSSLPSADVICDPALDANPDLMLSGVGMAFVVLSAVSNRFKKNGLNGLEMTEYLDLVALGSVADRASLTGQTRYFVKKGLEQINSSPSVGIKALMDVSALSVVDTEAIGFSLGPKLNAAGRLSHAREALALLMSESYEKAFSMAEHLNDLNQERKMLEAWITDEAAAQARIQAANGASGIVVHKDDWHQGVVGIVASRLTEMFGKPCLVSCKAGDVYKGSGRSVDGVHLLNAMKGCERHFLSFGGHAMAAGFKYAPEAQEALAKAFSVSCEKEFQTPQQEKPDGHASLWNVDFEDVAGIDKMEPCGDGNPRLSLASERVFLCDYKKKGSQTTLVVMDEQNRELTLTGPILPLEKDDLGRPMEVTFSPKTSTYMGAASVKRQVSKVRFLG